MCRAVFVTTVSEAEKMFLFMSVRKFHSKCNDPLGSSANTLCDKNL